MEEFGCALLLPELVNSSDQTSVPEAILGEKVFVATLLLVSPEATAIALTVRFEATRKGASYTIEEVVGVVPSSV
jgi:hypothetical protein